MYIYIGASKTVRKKDILAIFDLDTSTVSTHTRAYLNNAQAQGRVIPLGYDLPKAFVIMRDKTVYLSPFNTSTIIGRQSG